MGLKIDLSKVATASAAATSSSPLSFNLSGLTTPEAADTTDSTETHPSSYDLSGIDEASDINNTQNNANIPIAGINLVYTDGKAYDLDELIEIKRRSNSDCPLMVHVNTSDQYDATIIEAITKKILSDYSIEYSDDETASDYYKNQISKVPAYQTTFALYFNRYYADYYNNEKSKVSEGSISIDTAVENIFSISSDDLISLVTSGLPVNNNGTSDNKTQVQWEWDINDTDSTSATTISARIDALESQLASLKSSLSTTQIEIVDSPASAETTFVIYEGTSSGWDTYGYSGFYTADDGTTYFLTDTTNKYNSTDYTSGIYAEIDDAGNFTLNNLVYDPDTNEMSIA